MKKIFTFTITILTFLGIFFLWKNFYKNIYQNTWINTNFEQNVSDNTVQITTKNNEKITGISTGYKIEDYILTSAHGVNNDLDSIFVNGEKMKKIWSNKHRDIALLIPQKYTLKSEENFEKIFETIEEKYFEKNTKIGDKIFAIVNRNNIKIKIEGIIVKQNTEAVGYTPNGKIWKIFVKNLTDLEVQSGDSGTIIWTENGKIADIIHISDIK